MADEPKTRTLSELAQEEGFIKKPVLEPTQPTHMNLGKDPASMEFEVRDPTPDEIPAETDPGPSGAVEARSAEVTQVTQMIDDEPSEGLDELIELDESEDGLWLLMPIADVCVVRIAKTLPQRVYQKMIHLMRDRRKFAQANLKIEDMDADDLDNLLTMSEEILKLVVNPDDWPTIEEGLNSLTHPIGPAELGPIVSQIVPRYTRGVGGTKGKSQG